MKLTNAMGLLLATGLLSQSYSVNAEVEYSGVFTVEQRFFLQDAAFPEQARAQTSLTVTPEVFYDWNDGYDRITFKSPAT